LDVRCQGAMYGIVGIIIIIVQCHVLVVSCGGLVAVRLGWDGIEWTAGELKKK
jgi:hypothetical protein